MSVVDWATLIWVDYSLLAIVAICALMGFFRGVRYECYASLLWLLGLAVGIGFHREFSVALKQEFGALQLDLPATISALLLLTLVMGSLIGYLLGEAVACRGWFDRLLGVAAGAGRGLVIIVVLVLLAGLTPAPTESWWQEAQYINPFQSLVLRFRVLVPSEIGDSLQYN